jgi:membrane-bound lytic murein transglycosylase D
MRELRPHLESIAKNEGVTPTCCIRGERNRRGAALRFLDHLYHYFGSWYLAAAAYNAGPHKIARIMKKKYGRHTGTNRDYYRIWDDLPPQTRDYVPAILALQRIGRNPKKYGF